MSEKIIDYYKVLELSYDCSFSEIKAQYKKLILKHHPDINKSQDNLTKYKQILKAYSILKDPELRKEYDIMLKNNKIYNKKIKINFDLKKIIENKNNIFNKINIVFKNLNEYIKKNNKKDDEFIIDPDLKNLSNEELEIRLKESDNEYVRSNAALIIGYRKEKSLYHILEEAINDSSLIVRKSVIRALGNLKMQKSIQILLKMYYNSNNTLKEEIIKAIEKITNKKIDIIIDNIRS